MTALSEGAPLRSAGRKKINLALRFLTVSSALKNKSAASQPGDGYSEVGKIFTDSRFMDHKLLSVTLLKDKQRLSPEALAREGATDGFSSHKLKKPPKNMLVCLCTCKMQNIFLTFTPTHRSVTLITSTVSSGSHGNTSYRKKVLSPNFRELLSEIIFSDLTLRDISYVLHRVAPPRFSTGYKSVRAVCGYKSEDTDK